jgi:WXG100 family type VII secretion target
MPASIRVDPQQLADAGTRVDGFADQLQAGHGSAGAAADAAQTGLVGQSAHAIAAKAGDWQTTTAALGRVLASQGAALRAGAQGYGATEDNNAAVIEAVGAAGEETGV